MTAPFPPPRALGWRDEKHVFIPKGTGTGTPTFAQIGSSVFSGYHFAINDIGWETFHLDHDYALGTGIYPHIHWVPDGTNVQPVKFEVYWAAAKGHQQDSFDYASAASFFLTQTPVGTIYEHHITEIAAPGLVSAKFEPDTLIDIRFRRVANGGTANTDKIFVRFVDLHYQTDRLSTLNKAPGFYI